MSNTRMETSEIVGKMVSALTKKNKDYAIGYMESFIVGLIEKYVTDPNKLQDLRFDMLAKGIDVLIDVKKIG
jgi:hypothetical protein